MKEWKMKKIMIEDLIGAIKYELFGYEDAPWIKQMLKQIRLTIEDVLIDWERDGKITINE
jgi:hypothetical protein